MSANVFAVQYGDSAWKDLEGERITEATIERVCLLPDATAAGRPTVEILLRVQGGPMDGALIHTHTTWRLWDAASGAFLGWIQAEGLRS